jgi:hypothetical protein
VNLGRIAVFPLIDTGAQQTWEQGELQNPFGGNGTFMKSGWRFG